MSSKYVQRRAARPKDLKGTVRRILGYVFSFKAQILLVVGLIVLSVIASVASSYFLKPLINDYITPLIGQENPDFSGLLGMIGIMAAVFRFACFQLVGEPVKALGDVPDFPRAATSAGPPAMAVCLCDDRIVQTAQRLCNPAP
mgnify:CR=1 FL=1